MHKDIPSYMKALSGNDFELFESLISNKYKKFMKFYRLVENISDDIISLRYNFTSNDVLDVTIAFHSNADIDQIVMEIEKKLDTKKYECNIVTDEQELSISISLNE